MTIQAQQEYLNNDSTQDSCSQKARQSKTHKQEQELSALFVGKEEERAKVKKRNGTFNVVLGMSQSGGIDDSTGTT